MHYVEYDEDSGEIYSVGHSQDTVVLPSAVFLPNILLIPDDLLVRFNAEDWRVDPETREFVNRKMQP